jgi:hypothetical protein
MADDEDNRFLENYPSYYSVKEESFFTSTSHPLIRRRIMETIIKVVCFFLGLFVIVNGVWVAFMPPSGDEPVGLAIIAVGIFIPIITLSVAKRDEHRYD